jgi:lipopolysaccharide heptosyltransferase II
MIRRRFWRDLDLFRQATTMLEQRSASDLSRVKASRVCIIKPSALGDVVQSLPLLPVLRERFPSASISWVINSELAELLEGHPDLDEAIHFNRFASWRNWWQLGRNLRSRNFDLVFDLQGLLRSALLTAATRAPLRIGLETAREGAHLACHQTLPDSGRHVPAHLRYWRVAEAIGMGERRRETRIHIGDEHHAWAQGQLNSLPEQVVGVHLGAGWRTKRWPVEKFAVVAAKAARLYGCSIVLVGSKNDSFAGAQFEHLLRRVMSGAKVLNLTGKTGLKQLAAVLQRSLFLLTNDSGPMHLAAGVGTPVVGIFTCTSPLLSGPSGDQHEFVTTKLSCAASYRKRCPYRGKKHMGCFEEISTDRVWQAVVRLMQRKRAARAA